MRQGFPIRALELDSVDDRKFIHFHPTLKMKCGRFKPCGDNEVKALTSRQTVQRAAVKERRAVRVIEQEQEARAAA